MATTDYGTDFRSFPDLDAKLSTVSGPDLVVDAVMNRFRTTRGALWYDRDYGTDLRQFVNSVATRASIARAVESEAEKDERVLEADADVSVAGASISVVLRLTLAEGPFVLTISVNELTVDLVNFSQAA